MELVDAGMLERTRGTERAVTRRRTGGPSSAGVCPPRAASVSHWRITARRREPAREEIRATRTGAPDAPPPDARNVLRERVVQADAVRRRGTATASLAGVSFQPSRYVKRINNQRAAVL